MANPDRELLSELLAVPPRGVCAGARFLGELGDASAAAVVEAFNQGRSCHSITRTLLRRGHRVNQSSLARHLKGECQCPT